MLLTDGCIVIVVHCDSTTPGWMPPVLACKFELVRSERIARACRQLPRLCHCPSGTRSRGTGPLHSSNRGHELGSEPCLHVGIAGHGSQCARQPSTDCLVFCIGRLPREVHNSVHDFEPVTLSSLGKLLLAMAAADGRRECGRVARHREGVVHRGSRIVGKPPLHERPPNLTSFLNQHARGGLYRNTWSCAPAGQIFLGA